MEQRQAQISNVTPSNDVHPRLAEHLFFFFQAEDGIRDYKVTGVQTCALPISRRSAKEAAYAERFARMTRSIGGKCCSTSRRRISRKRRRRRLRATAFDWYSGKIGRASCRERV